MLFFNLPCLIYFDSNEEQNLNDSSLSSSLLCVFLSVYEKEDLRDGGARDRDSGRKKKVWLSTNIFSIRTVSLFLASLLW